MREREDAMESAAEAGVHPGAAEFERYVAGALSDAAVERVEAHVASCEACANALAREARLEMALAEVAAYAGVAGEARGAGEVVALPVASRRERVARAAGVGFAGLAAAAVVVFAMAAGGASGRRDAAVEHAGAVREAGGGAVAAGTEWCPDGADGQPCGRMAVYAGGDAAAATTTQ